MPNMRPQTGPIVKALTIHQPFAWMILNGHKDIEYRSWAAPDWIIGQPIALHAAASAPPASLLLELDEAVGRSVPRDEFTRSAVLGVMTIAQVKKGRYQGQVEYRWMLADIIRLATPVPCKGQLGFWNLSPAVTAAIEAQLASASRKRPHR